MKSILKRLTSTICEDSAVIVDELQTWRGFVFSSRVDEVDEFDEKECKRVEVIQVCYLSVFLEGVCEIGSFS